MGWRTLDKVILVLLIAAFAAVLFAGYGLVRTVQLNRAIERVLAGEDVVRDHPRVAFARAVLLSREDAFDDAVRAYAGIEAGKDAGFRADIRYNLANLYLRRGMDFRADDAGDLAMPLIELAKEGYRELLRRDGGDWAARYNLELALRLAPEADLEEIDEERNPEHNPRAAAGIQIRQPLP